MAINPGIQLKVSRRRGRKREKKREEARKGSREKEDLEEEAKAFKSKMIYVKNNRRNKSVDHARKAGKQQ